MWKFKWNIFNDQSNILKKMNKCEVCLIKIFNISIVIYAQNNHYNANIFLESL